MQYEIHHIYTRVVANKKLQSMRRKWWFLVYTQEGDYGLIRAEFSRAREKKEDDDARRCFVGKVERWFIYNVCKERKTAMAARARARIPTYISQPASSRQLSSDITEPKARAAVMQFESARLTLRIVARIRDAVFALRTERAFYIEEKRKKERKERGYFSLSILEFF